MTIIFNMWIFSGLIVSLSAIRDITKDEEIFVNYGYHHSGKSIDWYDEQKKVYDKEMSSKESNSSI
jgi:hypothetical protein